MLVCKRGREGERKREEERTGGREKERERERKRGREKERTGGREKERGQKQREVGRGAVDWEKKECVRCAGRYGRKECKKRATNGKVIKEERRGGEGHGRLI